MKIKSLIKVQFGRKLSYFSIKWSTSNKIMLVKKDKMWLKLWITLNIKSSKNSNCNDIMELISWFNDLVSIKKWRKTIHNIIFKAFTFCPVSLGDVQKAIMNLDFKKSSSSKSNSIIILKQSADIYLPFLSNLINHYLPENTFPDGVKQSKVIPL